MMMMIMPLHPSHRRRRLGRGVEHCLPAIPPPARLLANLATELSFPITLPFEMALHRDKGFSPEETFRSPEISSDKFLVAPLLL